MLPPPLGERGGHPHSCRRELLNDFEKESFNRAQKGVKTLKKFLFFINREQIISVNSSGTLVIQAQSSFLAGDLIKKNYTGPALS
jgi:hypothetical protein